MNMQQFILQENVLTDNVLLIADDGYLFKGGYKAVIKEYVFSSSWSDREVIKRFKNEETLHKYLSKNYPEFDQESIEII